MLTKLDMFFHFLKWADFKKLGVIKCIKSSWKSAKETHEYHLKQKRINNFDEKDLFN